MEVMMWIMGVSLYFVVVPALVYLQQERRYRDEWRWQSLVEVPEHAPGGSFRTVDGEPEPSHYVVEHRGAPTHVKQVAVISLVLGHMFVPGLLMGLLGLALGGGIGIVAIPGLVLAARIYLNAFGLLRCELGAASEARFLRRFAIVLNWAVMGVISVLTMIEFDLFPLWLFFAAYAVVSLVHARGLRQAAEAIEAVHGGVLPIKSTVPADCAASTPSSHEPVVAR